MRPTRHIRIDAQAAPPKQAALANAASAQLRQKALAQWDSEGGAGPDGPQMNEPRYEDGDDASSSMDADVVQLRIRVIALENLLIAVLAEGSERLAARAHEMARLISPRPGFTRHSLTINAARHILNLVERSDQIKATDPVTGSVDPPHSRGKS